MNRQGPGRIDWCDFTWNPVTGCLRGCNYCYARRIARRFGDKEFAPTVHPERWREPLLRKKPAKIFVCSNADLFGDWVPVKWIARVLGVARDCPQHTFIFLTKNPSRYADFNPWPEHCWLGATATHGREMSDAARTLSTVTRKVGFLSVEPLLGDVLDTREEDNIPDLFGIRWVIVGAQTGPGARAPDPQWLQNLSFITRQLNKSLFMKSSLKPYWPGELRKEWPR